MTALAPAAAARCAATSLLLDEPLAGSAPVATSWLLVEHAGPWGRAGWDDSGLDPHLVTAVRERTEAVGARIQLVRRHGVRHDARCTRVVLCRTASGGRWARTLEVDAPDRLTELPLEALASPTPPTVGEPVVGPVVLVCTHGRRDACCAELGRGAASSLTALPGADVWETTHTGGHRFAPNLVVLPDGVVYGRVGPGRLSEVVAAHTAGRVVVDLMRGRSAWSAWGQVAEIAVRARLGLAGGPDVDVVAVDEDGDRATVTVRTPAGRLLVDLDRVDTGRLRAVSCGDESLRDPGRVRVRDVRVGRAA